MYLVQVRLGYQQSLRPCQGGLTLNVDTAASAFLSEQPVLDFLLRTMGCRDQSQLLRMDATFYRKANKAIQNVKVRALLVLSRQQGAVWGKDEVSHLDSLWDSCKLC